MVSRMSCRGPDVTPQSQARRETQKGQEINLASPHGAAAHVKKKNPALLLRPAPFLSLI